MAIPDSGATLFDRAPFSIFRTDEIDSNFNSQPYAIAFVEFRPDRQTTMRIDLDNAIDTKGQRFRQFVDPNRTASRPTANEFRDRNSHVTVTFSINRTFGGSGAG